MTNTIDPLTCTKIELYEYGIARSTMFLEQNELTVPTFKKFNSRNTGLSQLPLIGKLTGFYNVKERTVNVNVAVTAQPVRKPKYRSWSYPGYKADRTAAGVVAHEVGHHLEAELSSRLKNWLSSWRDVVENSPAISSYEPSAAEAFAETTRLFILNPDLLNWACSARYIFFKNTLCLKEIETRSYTEVLNHPDYIRAAKNWIKKVGR
jgi:hypothetical protein